LTVAALGLFFLAPRSDAQSRPVAETSSPGPDRALIVVGLPGDAEHETLFRETVNAWQKWLTGPLRFPTGSVRILTAATGTAEAGEQTATLESIRREVSEIRTKLAPAGRLWVMFLGHANLREGHVYFHLPGPDLRDDECGALFQDIPCREQVFWITTAASGAFLPALSTPGRIVITATQGEQETNETEFPHALAEVCGREPKSLDQDGDGTISVLDVYLQTIQVVEARYHADKRVATEHALIDDNGDHSGTEHPDAAARPAGPGKPRDGTLARQTVIQKSGR
jgi:hypothetical protein